MKVEAELLVQCGYGSGHPELTEMDRKLGITEKSGAWRKEYIVKTNKRTVRIDPYADTLEGRRQHQALENYLAKNKSDLWEESADGYTSVFQDNHQWRSDRIKWCVKELEACSND